MLTYSALTFLLSFPWRSGVGSEQFSSHIYAHTSFAVSVWLYKTKHAKRNKIFEEHILLGGDIVNSGGSVLPLQKNTKRDFRLPPRYQCDLRCCGILRCIDNHSTLRKNPKDRISYYRSPPVAISRVDPDDGRCKFIWNVGIYVYVCLYVCVCVYIYTLTPWNRVHSWEANWFCS